MQEVHKLVVVEGAVEEEVVAELVDHKLALGCELEVRKRAPMDEGVHSRNLFQCLMVGHIYKENKIKSINVER